MLRRFDLSQARVIRCACIVQDWEWGVVIHETETDPEGWQYGCCLWGQRLPEHASTYNREHHLDCVKQRKWVMLKDQQAVEEACKVGGLTNGHTQLKLTRPHTQGDVNQSILYLSCLFPQSFESLGSNQDLNLPFLVSVVSVHHEPVERQRRIAKNSCACLSIHGSGSRRWGTSSDRSSWSNCTQDMYHLNGCLVLLLKL